MKKIKFYSVEILYVCLLQWINSNKKVLKMFLKTVRNYV